MNKSSIDNIGYLETVQCNLNYTGVNFPGLKTCRNHVQIYIQDVYKTKLPSNKERYTYSVDCPHCFNQLPISENIVSFNKEHVVKNQGTFNRTKFEKFVKSCLEKGVDSSAIYKNLKEHTFKIDEDNWEEVIFIDV